MAARTPKISTSHPRLTPRRQSFSAGPKHAWKYAYAMATLWLDDEGGRCSMYAVVSGGTPASFMRASSRRANAPSRWRWHSYRRYSKVVAVGCKPAGGGRRKRGTGAKLRLKVIAVYDLIAILRLVDHTKIAKKIRFLGKILQKTSSFLT